MTSVPNTITVGESFSFTKTFDDYPPDSFTLTYYFRGQSGSGFDKIAVADGTSFVVNVLPIDTAKISSGNYTFQAFISSAEVNVLVDQGELAVKPNLAKLPATSTHDNRSTVKITLDNIDAVIQKKATSDQLKYQIGTRSLERYSFTELLAVRKEYARLYAAEERAKAVANGEGVFKIHKVRFGVVR